MISMERVIFKFCSNSQISQFLHLVALGNISVSLVISVIMSTIICEVPPLESLLLEAKHAFQEKFPGFIPSISSCAPGRVNLIGEHTDYNDGFVLPMVNFLLAVRCGICHCIGNLIPGCGTV